jgi:hypothetical protein
MERATGPKPENLASVCFSSSVARRCSCSMVFSVRMAEMISRALLFSPEAMVAAGARLGISECGGCEVGGWAVVAGGDEDICGDGAVGGFSGAKSNRLGWRRDFSRAVYDGGRRS